MWPMEQTASQVSTFISPSPLLAHKEPLQLTTLEGQVEAAGRDRPRGGDFTITARFGAYY
jgi:hypothetical protein